MNIIKQINSKTRFKKLKDGWVQDKLLGIDWAPSSTYLMNFKAAEKYCKEQGGLLPTIEELRLLIDYRQYKPSVNKEFFGDTKFDDWYWSGTKCVNPDWSSFAWCVYFSDGYVNSFHKDSTSFVRPVRASRV